MNSYSEGGDPRDFLQLFCTCIRTERVRKCSSFSYFSMKFHAAKWKNLVFIRSDGLSMFFMLHAVIFYTDSGKDFHTLLELLCNNTPCLNKTHIQ